MTWRAQRSGKQLTLSRRLGFLSQLEYRGGTEKMSPEIEEFAKLLMERVRDASIQSNDRVLLPTAQHALAKRWARAARDQSPVDFARVLIPDVVDDTIFYLLQAIDDGSLRLAYTASNGTTVDLTQQGLSELAGWFAGSDGWREMYSKERFVDDLGDVKAESDSDGESR
jgi:hypothetical protein